jgi:ABC-type transporter Mla MlaB component
LLTWQKVPMFRITSLFKGDEILLKVEGSLIDEGVRELDTCWNAATACSPGHVRVDLTDVCRVDEAGRALMTTMYRAGADLVTRGCVMPELVREIAAADAGRRN